MKMIKVTTQFEGQHCWPDAPEEVIFLRNVHRHMFCVCVRMEVFHNDREIEFIILKHQVEDFIADADWPLHTSCEMMCESILEFIQSKYGPGRRISVEVSEDGENGAVVTN